VFMPTKLLLTPDQAAQTAFPPGCPVLYGFHRFSPESKNYDAVWEASEGVVRSVALDTKRRRFEFRVAARGAGKEDARDAELPADGAPDVVFEGDLAYAVHCPVTVAARDDDAAHVGGWPALAFPEVAFPQSCGEFAFAAAEGASEPDKARRGRVLCARPAFDEKTGAMAGVRYIVECAVGKGQQRTEKGVAPGRLSYADAAVTTSSTSDAAVRDVGATGRGRADGEIRTSIARAVESSKQGVIAA